MQTDDDAHFTCSSFEDHLHGRVFVWLSEELTWDEARARCSEGDYANMPVANRKTHFDFLRGMYDEYRSRGGDAVGAWIDGKYDYNTKTWHCYSNYNDACLSDMPWSRGEPNRNDTEHCILVWWSKTDGMASYNCSARMPAICTTYRYHFHVYFVPATLLNKLQFLVMCRCQASEILGIHRKRLICIS